MNKKLQIETVYITNIQIYKYTLRSAEQTAVQEKRRQYTYDERIYKRILYELFYLITKQI